MRFDRWWNPNLPQMLSIASFLLYFIAAFGLIFGLVFYFPIGTVIVFGAAAAGLGINNEKRWGWKLGLAISVLRLVPIVFLVLEDGLEELFRLDVLLDAAFPIALFALLIHPQTREHQKIWFN